MKENPRIALIGCGRWGSYILRDLLSLNCAVIVLELDDQRAAYAQSAQATEVIRSVDQLRNIDGIVIATPTSQHVDAIDKVAQIIPRVPIFCEKPLTMESKVAQRLSHELGDRLFVMDKWRYHTGVIELAKIAQSQEFGKPLGIKTNRLGCGIAHDDVDPVWILLPHDLGIAFHVLGTLPPVKLAIAEIPSPSGAWGLQAVLAAIGDVPWVHAHVSGCYAQNYRSIRLYCENAVIELEDSYAHSLKIIDLASQQKGKCWQKPPLRERPIEVNMPLFDELRAFVDYVQGRAEPPLSSAADAALIVQRIEELRVFAGLGRSS